MHGEGKACFSETPCIDKPLQGLCPDLPPEDLVADEQEARRGWSCDLVPALLGIRILLVDDAVDMRVLIAMLLRRAGAHVMLAAGAREALETLKITKPTIIISDIAMPRIDGYDLMRTIRAMPEADGGRIPAIALTACVTEKDRQMALSVGYQEHLGKPVGTDRLVNLILALVNKPTVH